MQIGLSQSQLKLGELESALEQGEHIVRVC
jgi:hypothetical protein